MNSIRTVAEVNKFEGGLEPGTETEVPAVARYSMCVNDLFQFCALVVHTLLYRIGFTKSKPIGYSLNKTLERVFELTKNV